MRIVVGLMLLRVGCCAAPNRAADAIGIWNVSPMRSMNPYPHSLTGRFQKHVRGEVFALDRTDAKGWTRTFSTILYIDGKARDYWDGTCSGTQSSRRVDRQTIEILQRCATGESTRFVRRAAFAWVVRSASGRSRVVDSRHQRAGSRQSRVAATPHARRHRGILKLEP